MAHQRLTAERHLVSNRPVVHIDVGSGTAHFLGKLSSIYTEANIPHYLIGVEVNDILAHSSANRLRAEGFCVEEHIAHSEEVESTGNELVLRRTYAVHEDLLRSLQCTADNRVAIVQDDIRKGAHVLFAVLRKLRSQGIEKADSISYSLPGTGTDLALEDSTEHSLSNNALMISKAPGLINNITASTVQLAEDVLGPHGTLTFYQRMLRGESLKSSYKTITKKEFPIDEIEQVHARMFLSMFLTLQSKIYAFRPKCAHVLIPEFEAIEKGAPTTNVALNWALETADATKSEGHDLFAISMVKNI